MLALYRRIVAWFLARKVRQLKMQGEDHKLMNRALRELNGDSYKAALEIYCSHHYRASTGLTAPARVALSDLLEEQETDRILEREGLN